MKKNDIQELAFQIIASIGECKYNAIQAFKDWKKDKNIKVALEKLHDAEIKLGNAGKKHLDIMQKEAEGLDLPFSMILMHAEDQYMTTQLLIEMMILIVE